MAHIRTICRKSGMSYKAIVKRGLTVKTKTFRTKCDARAWANRVEADIALMTAYGSAGASVTLDQLIDEYKRSDRPQLPQSHFNFWLEHLGTKTKLLDITPAHVAAGIEKRASQPAVRWMGKGRKPRNLGACKPATVNRYRTTLGVLFKYAIKVKCYLTENPVYKTATKTENNKRIRFLSNDEREALLKTCRASSWDRLHLLVVMAITTGARCGELLKLRWSNIDFQRRTASIATSKNGEPRVMPLPAITIRELMRFREVGNSLVFPSGIRPGQPFEFRKAWNAARDTAGLEDFRFHDLRHTCASYLAQHGATLLEIGAVLGHKSQQTTLRYAHLCIDSKQKLTDTIFSKVMDDG